MFCAPPRRDSTGRASMAASAPPNSLTSARKVAGPTFSLRISLSQASRWLRFSLTAGPWCPNLAAAFANPRLLALRQASDIGGVADVKKHGQQREQRGERPLTCEHQQRDAGSARNERRERGIA